MPDLMEKLVHPQELEDWRAYLANLSGPEPESRLVRIRDRSGNERWMEHVCKPVFDAEGRFLGRRGSNRDITERRRAEQDLDFFLHRDPLTGFPNRTLFIELLKHAVQQNEYAQNEFALLFLDLDKFKTINESLGHDAGDHVLLGGGQAAPRPASGHGHHRPHWRRRVQHASWSATPASPASILLAQRMIDALNEPILVDGNNLYIGASIGDCPLSRRRPRYRDPAEQRRRGAPSRPRPRDGACLRFFSPEMTQQARIRLTLEADLRHAIDHGGLRLHYQPQVDLRQRRHRRPGEPGALAPPEARLDLSRRLHPAGRGKRTGGAAGRTGPCVPPVIRSNTGPDGPAPWSDRGRMSP